MRIAFVSALALAALAQPLWADQRPPEAPWFGSGEGRVIYDTAAAATQLGCPLDDTASKQALIKAAATAAAGAKDPKVRAAFTEHAQKVQTWFDTYVKGVPEVGTWAELDKLHKEVEVIIKALPPNGDMKTTPEPYLKAAAVADRVNKVWEAVDSNSPCPNRPGKWNEWVYTLKNIKNQVESMFANGVAHDKELIDYWVQHKPDVPATPPSTYWENVDWVNKQLAYLEDGKKLQPQLDELALWAPNNAEAKTVLEQGRAAISAALANAQGIVTVLSATAMPALKKDAGHTKMVTKAVADAVAEGGKLMSGALDAGSKTSVNKWTEDVEVRRDSEKIWYRTVHYESEFFTTYYAWKPTAKTAHAPDLPGLASADICEIWRQNFTRYRKGDASKKNWFPSENALEGYLPCANVGKTSALKVK